MADVIRLKLIPDTWIISPVITKDQLMRWHDRGWIDDEDLHLDRAFPRNSNGNPIIFRMWLRSPLNKVVSCHNLDRKLLDFRILDDSGFEINYILIPDKPLKYRRSIQTNKPTTEYFEYIDGTYELDITVKTHNAKDFVTALVLAGKSVGLLSRTKHGYGKFSVKVVGDAKKS